MGGGAAVPRALMQAYQERFGIRLLQAWGLTETSPVAVVSYPPRGVELESAEGLDWRARTGRVLPGVELRIVGDDDSVLPWDGEAVGEIEARGSWITGAYYGDPAPEKFHDGWLRTGDIGSITPNGYVRISDRSKDVIKSGGEWISSVELEGHLMAHPCVAEAAVVGVPDPRWTERPLACVVLRPDASVTPAELQAFLVRVRRQVAAARAVDVHRRGAEDQRREVRQEGAARPVRRRRARGGGALIALTISGRP